MITLLELRDQAPEWKHRKTLRIRTFARHHYELMSNTHELLATAWIDDSPGHCVADITIPGIRANPVLRFYDRLALRKNLFRHSLDWKTPEKIIAESADDNYPLPNISFFYDGRKAFSIAEYPSGRYHTEYFRSFGAKGSWGALWKNQEERPVLQYKHFIANFEIALEQDTANTPAHLLFLSFYLMYRDRHYGVLHESE